MTTTKTNKLPSVLIVDDESNILRSIRRVLHKMEIELILVDSPEKALAVIAERQIDVVISDMKMPNISGAELLTQVAEKQPNTFRVVLSGYADVESILAAINKGRVHRYLYKPWQNEQLIEVINEGIERAMLRLENLRLLALTQAQNARLENNNQELERKVMLRTRQIRAAMKNIQQHSSALERALYNVIVSHPNIDGAFARQVSESASQLALVLNWDEKQRLTLTLASLICEIGQIGLPPELLEKPFFELNYEQQKRFNAQGDIARTILTPLVKLENEIALISQQFDSINTEPSPSQGARAIAICRDYWRYRTGRMIPRCLSADEARAELVKYTGVRYDKLLLEKFIAMDIKILNDADNGKILSSELEVNMILEKDLYNDSHILLLPEGHVFTETSIATVRQFEIGQRAKFALDVSLPVMQEDDEVTE